jgi:hypothetical protein
MKGVSLSILAVEVCDVRNHVAASVADDNTVSKFANTHNRSDL